MNQAYTLSIVFMLCLTTVSTGSLDEPEVIKINNSASGFDGHENDTIDRTNTFPFDIFYDDYYETSAEVYAQLLEFATQYPDIVEMYTLTDIIPQGQTWNGNEIYGVKISDNVANEPAFYDDPDEETYFLVSNHHSREWMTIPTVMYFIHYLTYYYGEGPIDNDGDGLVNEDIIDGVDNDGDGEQGGRVDEFGRALFDGIDNDGDGIIDEGIDEDPSEARVTHLVNNRETWIIPLLNPDGYNFDREDPDRFWRKNLRDNDENDRYGDECDGVDLNRNYPLEWSHNTQGQAVIGDDLEVELTVDDDNICSDVYHGPRDFFDDDGDCDSELCDTPISIGDQNSQTGIDEDPPDALHIDDDGDGMIDEDREGGFSEPETKVIEYFTWRLDIYPDYPQDKYLEDYQNGIIRDNWPEMYVTAPDGDYVRNYRPEAHDMKHNIMNSVSYHSYSALYIWPWGYKDQDPPHELYMENQVKPLMNVTGYGNWKDQGGYKVSGDITDFLYGMQGSFAYTVELNYANQGGLQGGFHADPLLIRPTVRMHLLTNIHFLDASPKARIGQMITSDTGNLGVDTINSPEETMMPELTILSNKDAEQVGFGTDSNVEFDEDKMYSNDDITVKVSVENSQYLLRDSLKLMYRTEKMEVDNWNEIVMSCISNCDAKDYSNYNSSDGFINVRTSVYEAKIPETEESMNVQFYAVGQDSRLAYGFGGGFVFTGYGNAEPITIFVDDIIGFGNPFVDFFAMIFMMSILYGVVWGGLYRAVGIATEAEKRKENEVTTTKRSRKAKRS